MLQVGQQVRVLEPFKYAFPEVYSVREVLTIEDGTNIYFLDSIDGAFDIKFLELVL